MSSMEKAATEVAIKSHIETGGTASALVPKTLDDFVRLSRALSRAGDMVPAPYRKQEEATLAALLSGAEIGLTPMQSLSSIAVINGRPCLWGDALPALMYRNGHSVDVTVEGEGDDAIATATLKRGDTGQVIVRQFSMRDAQKAGLLKNNTPWQTYPLRMLSHRARSWAIRDGAADALMGIQIAEEVQDYQPIKDVTPANRERPVSKVLQARQKADILPKEAEQAETEADDKASSQPPNDPEQDHTLNSVPPNETEAASGDAADVAPDEIEDAEEVEHSEDFVAGAKAKIDGLKKKQCPHAPDTDEANEWVAGWESVPQDEKEDDQ